MVSVIVPIYNVESYLRDCLDSLQNQNFEDFEVLLVDDGSSDNSAAICKEFSVNNKRFNYFRKMNGGLSSARNYGIKKARGEWLMFVDSDDIVSCDYISTMYNAVKDNSSKLAVCKYKKFNNTVPTNAYCSSFIKISKEDYLLQMFDANFMAAWNKIYHKSLFEKNLYPEGLIHEDFATTFKLVDMVDDLLISDSILYFYRNNPNGITLSKIKNNKMDLLKVYKMQIEYFFNKKDSDPYHLLYIKCSNQFFACFGTLLSYKKSDYCNYKDFKKNLSIFYKNSYNFIKKLPLNYINRILFIFSFKKVCLLKLISSLKRGLRYGT